MKVKLFELNPFRINCYLYFDEVSGEGFIIDPAVSGMEEENLIGDFIRRENIKVKYIINTHGHLDHVMGNKWAKEKFSAPILMHEEDNNMLAKVVEQGLMFGIQVETQPPVDKFIDEGNILSVNNCSLKVIHTPGHTKGGICLVDEKNKVVFSGDTLFKDSIGRTDLPGGDMQTLLNSISTKLYNLPDDFIVYPGHLSPTTIGDEKAGNPFVSG